MSLSRGSTGTSVTQLTLTDDRVEKKGDMLSTRLQIFLVDVKAVLKGDGQVHIVGPGEPISFADKAGHASFDYFMDQLLRRLVATS